MWLHTHIEREKYSKTRTVDKGYKVEVSSMMVNKGVE
jgi:hypothetical protein